MPPTSLALSAAERTELLRDPEAFAKRAEAVLTNAVQKLNRQDAERAAERVDLEQRYHELERSQTQLRIETERATAQHKQIAADQQKVVDARNAALADTARLSSELAAVKAEAARAKETEREGAEERSRLLQLNERKSSQLESTERDLASAHEALAQSKRHAADMERRAAEAEASALAAKLQASTQVGQLELANRRATQAEGFVEQLTAENATLRESKAEAAATSSAMQCAPPPRQRRRPKHPKDHAPPTMPTPRTRPSPRAHRASCTPHISDCRACGGGQC